MLASRRSARAWYGVAMKRWIVFGLVSLAVIVLVSPGIVGRLAERNLRDSIRWAEQGNEAFVVTEERFERSWFTAEGRHRIQLRSGILSPGSANDGESAAPVLIVETRIDHGLVPVTSMARDAGSLKPALASTVSTLSVNLPDGRVINLPGKLYSRIGLTGATVSHYALEPGSFRGTASDLAWHGADLRFAIDASASAMDYEGRLEPVEWNRDGASSRLGIIEFDGHQQKTDYGFATGNIALRAESASLAGMHGIPTGFRSVAFAAHNELASDRVNGRTSIDIAGLRVPGGDELDVGMDLVVHGLHAATLQRIRGTLDAARERGELESPVGRLYPLVKADLLALLAAGAEMRVDRLLLSLPSLAEGDVTATMRFELPRTDAADDTNADPQTAWPALLLALTASADIRVPAALVEIARAADPRQADALIATGILKRDGDAYVLRAEYARGLLTVNGAPMPIPLGSPSLGFNPQ